MVTVEVDVPVTVMVLLPITPRNIVGMLAENCTLEVMVLPDLVTVEEVVNSGTDRAMAQVC